MFDREIKYVRAGAGLNKSSTVHSADHRAARRRQRRAVAPPPPGAAAPAPDAARVPRALGAEDADGPARPSAEREVEEIAEAPRAVVVHQDLHNQEGKGRGIRRERGAGSGGKRVQEGKVMGAVPPRRQGDAGAGGQGDARLFQAGGKGEGNRETENEQAGAAVDEGGRVAPPDGDE